MPRKHCQPCDTPLPGQPRPHAAEFSATLSPYGPSLNSLAAVLGANASAERDGERLALEDVVSGVVDWNPRFAAAHGVPALEE